MEDSVVKNMPLGNDTVSRRIDEMSENVKLQIIEKLRIKHFQFKLINLLYVMAKPYYWHMRDMMIITI